MAGLLVLKLFHENVELFKRSLFLQKDIANEMFVIY